MKLNYPYYIVALLLCVPFFTMAQVGINTTNPQAQLDITASNATTPSNTDGLLVPRIDAFPATNPTATQQGMLVYLTTSVGLNTPGFYYWDHNTTNWVAITQSALETDPQVSSASINILPKWNGTTLVDGLVFDNGTNVGIGTLTPTDKVHVVGNIKVENGKMPFVNAGNSVYIGDNSGNTDPLTTTLGNVGVGKNTLANVSTFSGNTAIGNEALKNNTRNSNTAIGYFSLRNNTTGSWNVGLGQNSLILNTTGYDNIGIGGQALFNNTSGTENVALGDSASFSNTTGSSNVIIGNDAGFSNTTGSRNVFIGNSVAYNETGSDKLYIDNSNTSTPLIYGNFATNLLKINGTLNVNNAYNLPTIAGTANQVLQTDGAGNTSWVNPSGLPILETDPQVSSSTTNYIPKWNGTTLVDGQIFDNNVNIGIGTTTPSEKLEVNGNIKGATIYANTFLSTGATLSNSLGAVATFNTNANAPVLIGETTNSKGVMIGYDGSDIQGRSGSNLSVNSDLTINRYGGNVGIGMASPTEKLEVNGKTKTSDLQITNGATAGYVLQSDATGNGTWVNPSSLTITETDPQVSSATTNYVPKWNGTTLIDGQVFDNGTNVGVGTATPTDKVHVVGNIKVDGGKIPFVNTGQSIFIGEGAGLNDDLTSNQNVFIGWESGKLNTTGNLNTFVGHGSGWVNSTGVANSALGQFALGSNTTGDNNTAIGRAALSRNTTGNFNTASGFSALENITTGSFNASLGFSTLENNTTGNFNTALGSSAGFNNTGSSNVFIGYNAAYNETGSNLLYIDNSSTSTPLIYGDFATNLLKVNGTLNINNAYNLPTIAGAANQILQTNGAGITNWVNPSSLTITETDPQVSSATTNYVPKWNGTTLVDGQVFDDGTHVGVGTNTPATHFQVASDNTATNATIESGNQQYPTALSILPSSHATSKRSAIKLDDWQILQDVTGTGSKDFSIYQGATSSQRITIGTTGNVGIGINAPTEKLDVNGKTKTTNLQVTTGATSGFVLQSDASGNGTWVNPDSLPITETDPQVSSTTINYIPKWNGTTLVDGQVFDTGTNVGIGNNSPNALLTIGSNISPLLPFISKLSVNTTGNSPVFVGETTNQKGIIIGYDGNNIQGRSGANFAANSDLILNNYGGNVGINTTTPTEKLEVNGKTKTANLQVTTGATSGYVLRSDAVGNGTWVNSTSLAVTENDPQVSSTTTNYIPKWNGTTLVDGIIQDDATNIGIGTAPVTGNKVTVSGKTATTNIQVVNGATNGYVLQSDAAGNGTWVNSTSLSVTENDPQVSSTTTNYIPKWNGTTLVDGQVFDNGTNVGVGTSTPTDKVHVVGNVKVDGGKLPFVNTGNSVFIGQNAGLNDDLTSNDNTFIGTDAGRNNSTGSNNIAIGVGALRNNTTNNLNIAIGSSALTNASGYGNIGIGYNALNAVAGDYNLSFGVQSGQFLTSGDGNLFFGFNSGRNTTTGSGNVFLGYTSGSSNITGSNNVFIGSAAGFNETGSNKLYIDNTSTATPLIYGDFNSNLLRVNGTLNINNTYSLPIADGTTNQILQTNGAGVTSWVNPSTLSITETDPQVASSTTNYIPKWNGTTLVDGQVFDDGTNVGIGTTTPTQAKFVVNGFDTNTFANYGFLNRTTPTGTVNPAVAQNYSIYASNRIAASEFNAFSDERIKNIKGISNSKEDLKTLVAIEITDYRLKDSIAKGNNNYKKVIAQQVEKVYPQAVSKITDVIPDIYQQAEMRNGYVTLENTLKVGDKVKVIFESGEALVEIRDAHSKGFKIDSDKTEKIFVYGRQVTDFHTVDYEALSTLNISATQELLKRIETLEKENDTLRAEVQNLNNLKRDVEILKSFLFNSTIKKEETVQAGE